MKAFRVFTLKNSWLFTAICMAVGVSAVHADKKASSQKLSPLKPEIKTVMYSTTEDVLKKKPCKGKRRVTLHCRDKMHYVKSNEKRHDVFRKYIRNVGGAYAGVGSDQNFSMMAMARSKIAFMFDYDPVVVWINHVHRAFILHSPTRAEYLAKWEFKNWKTSYKLLKKEYKKHPEKAKIAWTYRNWMYVMNRYLKRRVGIHKRLMKKGKPLYANWLDKASTYNYIREMFRNNRIRIMKGDLLLNKSLQGIGKATHKMKIPLRILYLSNAEQFWGYTRQFRKNIRSFNMDKDSIILRTLGSRRYGAPLHYIWIYIIQRGLHFQEQLGKKVEKVIKRRRKIRRKKKWAVGSVYTLTKPVKKVFKGVFTLGNPSVRP